MAFWQNKAVLFSCGVMSCVFLQIGPVSATTQTHNLVGTAPIKASVEFRVASQDSKEIPGARVIVIDKSGKILNSGLTNQKGIWDAALTVEQDSRFKDVKQLGTVTTICVAKGYNEDITFEVPVHEGAVQPIILRQINGKARNEPTRSLGNLHRHTIVDLMNHYAEQYGLSKQAPINSDPGRTQWSPESKAGVR